MLRPFVIATLLIALITPVEAAPDIAALLKANAIPSVSYAQIKGGALVKAEAFGEQSPGVKATTATLYNIASLTKPLTAETILRLVSKGVFGLDDPMYSDFVDPDIANDPRSNTLTLRMALSHQAGFPNWRGKDGLKFIHDPGTTYGYSGEGYQYAAHFVEKKTGQTFVSLADATLLGPLALKSTSYVGQPWFEGHIALPADEAGNSLPPHITNRFIAADLVYTTAQDYARFMLAVLKDEDLSKAVAGDRVRVQRSIREHDCTGAKAATCPADIGPGLGWQVLTFPNHTVLMHTGRDPGLFTFAWLDKNTGDGAVILTNGEHGDKIVLPLLEALGTDPAFLAYLKSQST